MRIAAELWSSGRGWGPGREAEYVFLHKIYEAFERRETHRLKTVVGIRNEFVNFRFILGKEGVDVGLVEDACALGLGQDEVGEEEEAEVGVKREPRKKRPCSQIRLWELR